MYKDINNPLDGVEDILLNQNWVFDRPDEDTLKVNVTGKNGQYTMNFDWDENLEAMKFCCEFDLSLSKNRVDIASRAVHNANYRLWLGHFIINEKTLTPCFCHTSLFRGWTHASGTDHVADLIQVALDECERHYSLFDMLSNSVYISDAQLSLALMEEQGEA